MVNRRVKKGLEVMTACLLMGIIWAVFTNSNGSFVPLPIRLFKNVSIMADWKAPCHTNGSDSNLLVTIPYVTEKSVSAVKLDKRTSSDDMKCIGAQEGQSEDLFCLERPVTLSNYKNPCWKDANQSTRCLPYFHLIGSDKCGSTDLFNRIQQHPDVTTCECVIGKESWYWSWERYGYHGKARVRKMKLFSQYISQFDKAAKLIDERASDGYHNLVVGDGTPMDFWDFRGWTTIPQNKGLSEPRVLTPHLMRHMYRDTKMILIMRNPVDRLYSDYYFLKYGDSPQSFHRDVVRSIEVMNDCLRTKTTAGCFYSEDMYRKLPSRIHLGCYAVFLKEWLSVFPRDNFLFLRTEDYKVDIAKTISHVYDFLQLRPLGASEIDSIENLKRKHVTEVKKRAPPMFNSTRDILTNFYEAYNNELAYILKDERFLWRSE